MEKGQLTYKRGLEIISESAKEYYEQRKLYENKKNELVKVEDRIQSIEKHISDLKKNTLSLDDLKKDRISKAEMDYARDIEEAERVLKQTIDTIDYSEAEDREAEKAIKETYSDKINNAFANVVNIEDQIGNTEYRISEAELKCEDLNQQIHNSTLEKNQIKLCAAHIASDFDNVAKNAEFINDYQDPRGATPSEAKDKFSSLSPKKIKKIATKMNSGAYVSSPDESKGLPIMEILHMATATIWMILKAVFQGICLLYKPMYRFYKFTYKIIYVGAVTLALLLLVLFISSRFGNGIITILLILLYVIIAIFIGMIVFNVVKFSNKTFRKELNLEYYTVGYYFTVAKDEILFKIASEYYADLKTKNPMELDRILQSTVGVLTDRKQGVDSELADLQVHLTELQSSFSAAKDAYSAEKELLEEERDVLISAKLEQLKNDRISRKDNAQKVYDEAVASSKRKKEHEIENAEQNAINTRERDEQEISDNERKLQDEIGLRDVINTEMKGIAGKAKHELERNNYMAVEYKKQEISIVEKRAENDQIPNILVAGLVGERLANLVTEEPEDIYKQYIIEHLKKPIIITCEIDDDESKVLTENYYSFIDSLICDLLGKTYIGAFRFVLVDSKGNKPGIIKCMDACRTSIDELERFGCVKMIMGESIRSDKCFDEVIKEQERLLNGKPIDSVNEAKKNLDNMVKYNFLCVRIYTKANDFQVVDFRKRIDSALNNGIIPIIIMSQNYFEEKRSDLEGAIRELCDNHYYQFELDKNASNSVKEVKFSKKKIQ